MLNPIKSLPSIFQFKSIAISITMLLFVVACNKGEWVTDSTYRPKRPSFSIRKIPFQPNTLVDNQYLYISTKKMINYDGTISHRHAGFYADGRMIFDGFDEREADLVLSRDNSFENAAAIGYYTTKGNIIRIQHFASGDGGMYRDSEGLIRVDTIILIDTVPMLLKRDIRYDTLVLSRYPLK
jgi:hypothetical protein